MEQSEHETVPESSDSTVAVDEQPQTTPDVAPTNGRPDPTRGFLSLIHI